METPPLPRGGGISKGADVGGPQDMIPSISHASGQHQPDNSPTRIAQLCADSDDALAALPVRLPVPVPVLLPLPSVAELLAEIAAKRQDCAQVINDSAAGLLKARDIFRAHQNYIADRLEIIWTHHPKTKQKEIMAVTGFFQSDVSKYRTWIRNGRVGFINERNIQRRIKDGDKLRTIASACGVTPETPLLSTSTKALARLKRAWRAMNDGDRQKAVAFQNSNPKATQ